VFWTARVYRRFQPRLTTPNNNHRPLAERRKGDPTKVTLARRLRRDTTMTLAWIATRLQMGTAGHLSHLLYWQRRATK
jgi:hypothetical protein